MLLPRHCRVHYGRRYLAEDRKYQFRSLTTPSDSSANEPERHIFRVPATESSVRPRPGVADSVASRFRVIAPRELQGLMVSVYVIYLTSST